MTVYNCNVPQPPPPIPAMRLSPFQVRMPLNQGLSSAIAMITFHALSLPFFFFYFCTSRTSCTCDIPSSFPHRHRRRGMKKTLGDAYYYATTTFSRSIYKSQVNVIHVHHRYYNTPRTTDLGLGLIGIFIKEGDEKKRCPTSCFLFFFFLFVPLYYKPVR